MWPLTLFPLRPSRLALGALALGALLSACERATPVPGVVIQSFEAASETLNVGQTLRLTWRTEGASACTLEVTPVAGGAPAGTTYEPDNCAQGSLDHPTTDAGRFEATLSALGAAGGRAERSLTFEVVGDADGDLEAPTARFRVLPGDGPLSFVFEADDAPTGRALRWDFGDGSAAEGARVTHRYAAPGDYTVTLTVEGAGGSASASQPLAARGERLVLFDGSDLEAWERVAGGEANWPVEDGAFEVLPGARVSENNLRTKETFGDFRLHLEFWVPATPEGTPQARGNSGVYLQGRYEVQILDSYGVTLTGADDAGAIYGVKDADVNASLPPETWQRFDITFRAARFAGGRKVENARVSVRWNGVLVHDDVEIPRHTLLGDPEGPEDGPVVLQDHGSRVRFRNVWLEPL